MIRRPPRSTPLYSSAASDVYKRQVHVCGDRKQFCGELILLTAEVYIVQNGRDVGSEHARIDEFVLSQSFKVRSWGDRLAILDRNDVGCRASNICEYAVFDALCEKGGRGRPV